MVYGYKTNEEFIDRSYQLLEKLSAKGLWDKDTLIIGLDKSVRPLAYTLKKISDIEGKKTPDIRFFNYNAHGGIDVKEVKKLVRTLKQNFDFNKLSNYKNILVLDEHISSGTSLGSMRYLLQKCFSEGYLFKKEKVPNIKLAVLGVVPGQDRFRILDENEFISINKGYPTTADLEDSGIEDGGYLFENQFNIKKSIRVQHEEKRQQFIKNRFQLSSDIKQYLHEKHPERLDKNKSLEKALQTFSVLSFIAGIFLSSSIITGNVVGDAFYMPNITGIVLIFLGILGLFFSRKFRN